MVYGLKILVALMNLYALLHGYQFIVLLSEIFRVSCNTIIASDAIKITARQR